MKKHVVIIEHDSESLDIVSRCLENNKYVVTQFSCFPSMPELTFMRADCFIINAWLPQVSGHAICLMLKAKVQTRPIPVILLSSRGHGELVENICEADVILQWPCPAHKLLDAVSAILTHPVSLS